MKREYAFFDMEPVLFDDESSVKELMECVFSRSDYYEPAGMEIVTALDVHRQHIVTDKNNKCKEELKGEGANCFCVHTISPKSSILRKAAGGTIWQIWMRSDIFPTRFPFNFDNENRERCRSAYRCRVS